MKPIVKICGITNLVDALHSVKAGADALGFVFAKSPRKISPRKAMEIIVKLPPGVRKVGVFVDEVPEAVERIAKTCGLDTVQLHGGETPSDCRYLSGKGLDVIKAFRVKDETSIKGISKYKSADMVLLDCHKEGKFGGTGIRFDWRIAVAAKKTGKKIIVSGGLACDNIEEAIKTTRPYGVDASSRLEISPGKKDHKLVGKFIKKVKGS